MGSLGPASGPLGYLALWSVPWKIHVCDQFKKRCLGAAKENAQESSQKAEQKDKEHVYGNKGKCQRAWTKHSVSLPQADPDQGR